VQIRSGDEVRPDRPSATSMQTRLPGMTPVTTALLCDVT
jgi:hypothetical protein